MSAGSILFVVLAAVIDAPPAQGICVLEPVPEGVRARSCVDGNSWMIACPGPRGDPRAAPPVASAVKGAGGGTFGDATLGVIKQGQVVDVQVSDGASLWLGVSERRDGRLRPRGLVRYDRMRDTAHHFRGTDSGPCGFHVQDLLLRDDTLWVATDLGVSRLRLSPDEWDEWTHYGASTDDAALEETACGALLAVVAEAAAAPGGEALGQLLAEFRPRFVKRLRGMRPASPRVGRRN